MRPLELRLAHFGPYREPAALNFEALDRLFLVCGPTGAGKTTLFDALTFALYEQTAGTRGGLSDQLASHHAPPGAVPEVFLRFALGDQQWRVTRQLRHRVPRKKGEGWVVQEPQVLLEKRTPEGWEPVPGKRSEINQKLEELVGLSADEFGKIVVLPQGDFQRFLEASTGDRERMLRKLFPVEVYDRFVEDLKNRAKAVEETRLRWEDRWEELSRKAPATEDRQVLEAAAAEAAQGAQDAADEEAKIAADLVRLQTLHADWKALEAVREAQDRLEGKRPGVEASRALLDRGRQARAHGPDLDRQETILREGKTLRADQDGLREQLAQVEARRAGLDATADQAAVWEARLVEVVKQRGAGEHLADQWKTIQGLTRDEAGARQREAEATARWTAAREARLRAEAALGPAPQGLSWDDTLREGEAAQARVRQAQWRLEEAEAARAAEQAERLARESDREVLVWTQIHDALGAAHLADSLAEGQPCPVCGSTAHPAPAARPEASADAPRRLAEARSEQAKRRAEAAEAAGRRDALGAQAAALGPGEVPLEEARRALAAVEARRKELQAWNAAQDAARAAVAGARDQEEAADRDRQAATLARETFTHKLAALSDRVTEDPTPRLRALAEEEGQLRKALEERRLQAEFLDRERGSLRTRIEGLEVRLESQRDEYRRLQASLEAGAQALGWSVDELRQARRPEAELVGWEQDVGLFDREVHRLAGERSALEGRFQGPPPPLADLVRTLEESQQRRKAKEAEAKEREFALRERDQIDGELREIARQKDAVEAEFQRLVPLAKAFDGHNAANLKLTTWVLVQALEQVTRSATHRLAAMSGGRYALRVQTQGSDARRAWGLDLAVIDGYTGQERAVGTLSGGEKFMTSISLALGLADVIQERSGGMRLEAIFIDEGFGTLDDQSLERAMAILHDLGQHRSVGIISHVSELRSRIASRVEVIKGRTGSTLRVE